MDSFLFSNNMKAKLFYVLPLILVSCKSSPELKTIGTTPSDVKAIKSIYDPKADTSLLTLQVILRQFSLSLDISDADMNYEIAKSSYENSGDEYQRKQANYWVRRYKKLIALYERQTDTLTRIYKYKSK